MRTKIVTLPTGQQVKFVHRDDMRKVFRNRASLPKAVPVTILPVDDSGDGTCPCPMDGNDTLGNCGSCMCAHTNGIRSFGQGKSGFNIIQAPVAQLESQYLTVSGGDNGTDESMLVGDNGGPGGATGPGIWLTGIAGNPVAIVVDHLDIDITDVPLVQYCHDQFYATCLAWSVPDAFIQNWTNGSSWLTAMTPDPANGHFTPLADVTTQGYYRMFTWGGYNFVSNAFLASVQPQAFVTFSALQFNSLGYDSHGRHISDVANSWISIGGNASIVNALITKYPPKTAPPTPTPNPVPTPSPVPTPAPTPTPVTSGPSLAQAQQAIANAFNLVKFPLIDEQTASSIAQNALVPLW
jgi:hypothetical protein